MIWNNPPDIAAINRMLDQTLSGALGMRITGAGDAHLEGEMPVDARTIQPFGVLHGGATAALAETLGSFASHLVVDSERQFAVGIDLNITHLRAVRKGIVTGRAEPLRIGSTVHVWRVTITDSEGRHVSEARLTTLIRDISRR